MDTLAIIRDHAFNIVQTYLLDNFYTVNLLQVWSHFCQRTTCMQFKTFQIRQEESIRRSNNSAVDSFIVAPVSEASPNKCRGVELLHTVGAIDRRCSLLVQFLQMKNH